MIRLQRCGVAIAAVLAAGGAYAQFSEDFETYSVGPLVNQGPWVAEGTAPNAAITVTSTSVSPRLGSTRAVRMQFPAYVAGVDTARRLAMRPVPQVSTGVYKFSFDMMMEANNMTPSNVTNMIARLRLYTPAANNPQIIQPYLQNGGSPRYAINGFFDPDGKGTLEGYIGDSFANFAQGYDPNVWYNVSFLMDFDKKQVVDIEVREIDMSGNLGPIVVGLPGQIYFQNSGGVFNDVLGKISLACDPSGAGGESAYFDNFEMTPTSRPVYTTIFDSNGFDSYSPGSLDGQFGWTASAQDGGTVPSIVDSPVSTMNAAGTKVLKYQVGPRLQSTDPESGSISSLTLFDMIAVGWTKVIMSADIYRVQDQPDSSQPNPYYHSNFYFGPLVNPGADPYYGLQWDIGGTLPFGWVAAAGSTGTKRNGWRTITWEYDLQSMMARTSYGNVMVDNEFQLLNWTEFRGLWFEMWHQAGSDKPNGDFALVDNLKVVGLGGSLPGIPGDIDHDGDVDIDDYDILAYAYGSFAGDPNWNAAADLDNDGDVDIDDYDILANNYGRMS